jgi:protocatechuate 3,4-dioxygenase alpha subunit
MSDEKPVATPSQTVGPFFHFGMTAHIGAAAPPTDAERVRLLVTVLDGDGAPLDDAVVEYWHKVADAETAHCGRAATAKDGTCRIETVRPAGHVNLCIFARGLLRHLFTRVYFPGDAAAADPVLSLVPPDRRATLFATADGPGAWRFDVHLQGAHETVFFDR